ncbi:MAG: sigma-70 family RNA polymerase sigma factor [Micavibrio sp.]
MNVRAQKILQDDPGDDVLIARIVARDEQAFAMITTRYSGIIFAIGYRMYANRTAAEDLVQDTFLKLWIHAGDWSPERGASVKTWLCHIASNLCIDRLRKSGREVLGDVPEQAGTDDNAEVSMGKAEIGAMVSSALQTLPDRQRLALIMFHYEEMSVIEIAAVLDTTPKAAEGLLSRGRIALKEALLPHKDEVMR